MASNDEILTYDHFGAHLPPIWAKKTAVWVLNLIASLARPKVGCDYES